MRSKSYQWWHGVAFYVGVQAARLAFRAATRILVKLDESRTAELDRTYYEAQKLPIFAPPGIAFPIAWGINSISLITGGLYVLNLPVKTTGRKKFIRLQAGGWLLFALFDAAYFGLRSPVNAALVTFLYSVTTAASLDVAFRKMRDLPAGLSLATTVAWLLVANPVGITQALWNRDTFWKIGPFMKPPPGWVKTRLNDT